MPDPDGFNPLDNSLQHQFPASRRDLPEFHLPALGLLFRYEILAELPFDLESFTTSDGSTTLATRRYAPAYPRPYLEASVQSPALGIAADRTHLSLLPNPLSLYRFVLHIPQADLYVPVNYHELSGSSTPIPGGAAWSRQVIEPPRWPQQYDPRDARLIILKPVVLAEIERTITVPRDTGESHDSTSDWLLSRNYGLTLAAYLENHRPFRPDPATCTADEFARYLRVVSAIPYSEIAERDLAEYAPRFSRLLALHSRRSPAAHAIVRGTPESERESMLGALRDNPDLASQLSAVLVERDWHENVAGLLLENFARNPQGTEQWHAIGTPLATSLALLEDPATYPELLGALEQSRTFALYETIRHLPDISPALDESIARISRDLSPAAELAGVKRGLLFGVFDAFKVPVSHGSDLALSKLLELWRMTPLETDSFDALRRFTTFFEPEPAIPDTLDTLNSWRAFIAGKSPTDFTYDPLTRKWRASAQP